ncbi:unnamed protein product [Vitrella brassicaformis CCMP3155]|uniref:G domain-containing protein n=1 Tax=Vitrella brassicaformis (strain CCMP3155) TaxID=1169540 RepID=A0A0G4ENB4_VITBC|nr:unnamed protein product [Vitrella brassicaformis CCMP3155]|eukprot:CEL98626.1 unnamed protein product [Vitrella brassicaformis CCMP3155]
MGNVVSTVASAVFQAVPYVLAAVEVAKLPFGGGGGGPVPEAVRRAAKGAAEEMETQAEANRQQNEADLQRRHEQQLFAAQDEGARKALAEEEERKRKFEQDYPRTEYQKQAMEDHPNRAQVMLCGNAGTGKSTLINLLMMVVSHLYALARGGSTVARAAVSALGECTERPTVYTFAEDSPLFHLAIMIDTPGAGTLLVPEDTYPRMIGIRYATIVLLVVAERLRAIDHKIY